MNTIYEALYPFGAKKLENMPDNFIIQFPYTDVPPDPDRDLMLQFLDVKRNTWRPVEYMAGEEKLALLESFYDKVRSGVEDIQEVNEKLEKENSEMAAQLTDTQIALAEVFELVLGSDEELGGADAQ